MAHTVFSEGDDVRVAHLNQAVRPVTGTDGVIRQPKVGDEGEVVALRPPESPTHIAVDCIEEGRLVWSADFEPNELEKVA